MAKFRLRYLGGPRRGQQVVFPGPRVRIGRSRDNDLVLADRDAPASSGHHAEAVFEAGRWWIHDLGSTNGTWVNGARVSRTPVNSGDLLVIGDDRFAIETRRSIVVAVGAVVLVIAAGVSAYALWGRSVANFERTADRVSQSVYLIAFEDPAGRRPLGSAFAVGAGMLATNAHVADALQKAIMDPCCSRRAIAIRSASEDVRKVVAFHLHPDWRAGSIANDAALLALDSAVPVMPLRLAEGATVAHLARGTMLGSLGFPAANLLASRPVARLSTGALYDLRGGRYMAVGLNVVPGMSGSPIFDPGGVVVGVVAGAAPTGSERTSPERFTWGISVAVVEELIRQRNSASP